MPQSRFPFSQKLCSNTSIGISPHQHPLKDEANPLGGLLDRPISQERQHHTLIYPKFGYDRLT